MDLLLARWARTIAGPAAKTVQIVPASAWNVMNAGLKSVANGWIAAGAASVTGMMQVRVIASRVASSTRIVTSAMAGMAHAVDLNAMTAMVETGCAAMVIANRVACVAVLAMGVVQTAVTAPGCVAIAAMHVVIVI